MAGATTPPAQVDTHTLAYRQDGGVSAQQLWEWDTTGVTTGGQLRNRDSGLCLEVNGNSGNVDQWTCDPTSANHRWRIVTETNGVTRLRVDLPAGDTPRPAGTYFLATTSASDKTVNGTTLTLTLDSQDERTEWSALPQT